MASMSEQRTIGAIIILVEGVLGFTQDAGLRAALEDTHKALLGYMAEQDAARKEKLAMLDAVKSGDESDSGFDRAGYNRSLIASIGQMGEVEITITHDKTKNGKPVTKIEFDDENQKSVFLYDFKTWNNTGTRWLKGSELARLLWVNNKGYLSLDAKKAQAVIMAGVDRVSEDIPF